MVFFVFFLHIKSKLRGKVFFFMSNLHQVVDDCKEQVHFNTWYKLDRPYILWVIWTGLIFMTQIFI